MQYRRSRVAGATYFFTVNLDDRQQTWLVDHIDILRQALRSVKQRHPFTLNAIGGTPGSSARALDAPAGQ